MGKPSRSTADVTALKTVDLSSASDELLVRISSTMGLNLNLAEMQRLRDYFRGRRQPTDVELQAIGQTWSEHCIHKTFRGDVVTESGVIRGLLRSYIARATRELNKEWCFSVFEDNAGMVDFDLGQVIAAKVETHNHPSAVEPFGGAATGTGGVIRDVLGVWGEPIALTDVLCFGPLGMRYEDLPPGVKHPRYIYKGVVAGVGAYGNNMGIPTVSGAVIFDEGYTGNVTVYCGCVGILPKDKYVRRTRAGDLAILAGGKTGRDGIHGVTFASAELSEAVDELRSAVQIPNPLVEERLKRAVIRIRDEGLASGTTDLGGGGLSSAIGEMAHRSGLGVTVNLDVVWLKEANMAPWEIWVSESQERMLFSVPEGNEGRVLEILAEEELEAGVLGRFDGSGRLVVMYRGTEAANLDLDFLFSPPCAVRRAARVPVSGGEPPPEIEEPPDLAEELLTLLSTPNIRSKEDVIRTYDFEVRGCTAVKPIHGYEAGPSDAAVIKPLRESWMGAVISCGINPFYPDPYWMAAASIEEAVRNAVAVGGRRIALLDNFVWGNPEYEDRMGALVRAVEACYDFSKALDAPFISGKDSLYNESPLGPVRPTLLITGIAIMPDVRRAITLDLKEMGDPVYLVGTTKEELAGSAYFRLRGAGGGAVPKVDGRVSSATMDAVIGAMDGGLVMACHDLSEGGLGVAAAEMAISSENLGLSIDLARAAGGNMRDDFILFSESQSRFLIEVRKASEAAFLSAMEAGGVPCARIGEVGEPGLNIRGAKGEAYRLSPEELRETWRGY